jgi:hypothetical protein
MHRIHVGLHAKSLSMSDQSENKLLLIVFRKFVQHQISRNTTVPELYLVCMRVDKPTVNYRCSAVTRTNSITPWAALEHCDRVWAWVLRQITGNLKTNKLLCKCSRIGPLARFPYYIVEHLLRSPIHKYNCSYDERHGQRIYVVETGSLWILLAWLLVSLQSGRLAVRISYPFQHRSC